MVMNLNISVQLNIKLKHYADIKFYKYLALYDSCLLVTALFPASPSIPRQIPGSRDHFCLIPLHPFCNMYRLDFLVIAQKIAISYLNQHN